MPCNDGGPSYGQSYPVENPVNIEMKHRLDAYARLLCHACALLESKHINMGHELSDWYAVHKAEDERKAQEAAARLVRETKLKRRKQYLKSVKMRVLSQLDPDEREALGV